MLTKQPNSREVLAWIERTARVVRGEVQLSGPRLNQVAISSDGAVSADSAGAASRPPAMGRREMSRGLQFEHCQEDCLGSLHEVAGGQRNDVSRRKRAHPVPCNRQQLGLRPALLNLDLGLFAQCFQIGFDALALQQQHHLVLDLLEGLDLLFAQFFEPYHVPTEA